MSDLRSNGWKPRKSNYALNLLEHPQDRTGEEYTAIVGSQSRKRVDLKALADEIGASVLARFTSLRSMMVVRLRELSGG